MMTDIDPEEIPTITLKEMLRQIKEARASAKTLCGKEGCKSHAFYCSNCWITDIRNAEKEARADERAALLRKGCCGKAECHFADCKNKATECQEHVNSEVKEAYAKGKADNFKEWDKWRCRCAILETLVEQAKQKRFICKEHGCVMDGCQMHARDAFENGVELGIKKGQADLIEKMKKYEACYQFALKLEDDIKKASESASEKKK